MKLYATIENEQGKQASKAGNEYLDIDIFSGNTKIASLTVREGEYGIAVFNENDRDIKIADCAYNQMHNDGSYCAPCTGHASAPKHEPRTCENSVPCYECMEIERPEDYQRHMRLMNK